MQIKNIIITMSIIGVISGCGTNDYPCGEPTNGRCASVTDNYNRSMHEYTNPDDVAPPHGFFGGSGDNKDSSSTKPINYFGFIKSTQLPYAGAPLASSPRMMRVWLTSYTDDDNIYHDQAYEFILTDRSHWIYNNNTRSHFTGLKNVTLDQSKGVKGASSGSYGLSGSGFGAKSKPTVNNNPSSVLGDFPAINALKSGQTPMTTAVGSGIDKTTIIP